LAYLNFGSKTALVSALLACACGGSSAEGRGGGGNSGAMAGANGGGSGSKGEGAAGSKGLAGSSGVAGSKGLAGSNGVGGSSGVAGSGASGAGNSAGAADNGSACPTVTPCGGDLVGDWTIKETCLSGATKALEAICPGASFTVLQPTATGTASFRADNTLVSSAIVSFVETIHFPASCYTETDCTIYAAALSAAPTVTNAQCTYDVVTGCSCSANSTQAPMGSGTYQVQGTNVTITDASGKVGVDSFCVSGNTLSLQGVDASGISTTMILTK